MTGQISGKALNITINGVQIAGPAAWFATEEADKLDGTVGTDQGTRSTKLGVTGISGTLKFKVNILAGLGSIRAQQVSNLRLYYAVTDATPAYVITTASIFNVRKGAEVRGQFEVDCEFESDGTFTINA